MTLGVLGGTFDPIHFGHITAALRAQAALLLDRVLLMPSRIPPHRVATVGASPDARLAMATLAAAEQQGWTASDLELKRDGPSYTVDTLMELRRSVGGEAGIFFIIGADAFAEIATWARYPDVVDLAHFAVVARPGITLHSLQSRVPDLADRMTTPALFKPQAASPKPDGKTRVILIETATPDVSSTEIRRRVRTGERIDGLVPDAVADYLATHRLYVEATL